MGVSPRESNLLILPLFPTAGEERVRRPPFSREVWFVWVFGFRRNARARWISPPFNLEMTKRCFTSSPGHSYKSIFLHNTYMSSAPVISFEDIVSLVFAGSVLWLFKDMNESFTSNLWQHCNAMQRHNPYNICLYMCAISRYFMQSNAIIDWMLLHIFHKYISIVN